MNAQTLRNVEEWVRGIRREIDPTRPAETRMITIPTVEGPQEVEDRVLFYRTMKISDYPGDDEYEILKEAFPDGRIPLMAYAFGWPVTYTPAELQLREDLWLATKPPYADPDTDASYAEEVEKAQREGRQPRPRRFGFTEEEKNDFQRDILRRIFLAAANPRMRGQPVPRLAGMERMGIDPYKNQMVPQWESFLGGLPKNAVVRLGDLDIPINNDILRMRYRFFEDMGEYAENMVYPVSDDALDNITMQVQEVVPGLTPEGIQRMATMVFNSANRLLDLNRAQLTPQQAMGLVVFINYFNPQGEPATTYHRNEGATPTLLSPYDSFLAIHGGRPENTFITQDFAERYGLPVTLSATRNRDRMIAEKNANRT